MRIVNEEVFGPVALLLPFETEEELLKMVNGTSYQSLLPLFFS
jgi:acyl-CoA reductase-like NAD-dependent aldehyde dehydrogenase